MRVGVPKETRPGERRVAVTPARIKALLDVGVAVAVEEGAGEEAGFPNASYEREGALVGPRGLVFDADVLLQVHTAAAPSRGRPQTRIGLADPLGSPSDIAELAANGVTLFALELLPRITRAQSMDVLSSMATLSGYKAALLAAERLPKIFPMMVTAAGTLAPARVLVLGAGVAGLSAIATSRRLGAVVTAYDVRPEVKEEVESVGGRFAELPLDTTDASDERGYARPLGEDFYSRQREHMHRLVSGVDVVITTAAIPGRAAPRLVTEAMFEHMNEGSVIVDLAAASGGNCEGAAPDTVTHRKGVTILGPTNLPASVPCHASQLYAKNITTFFLQLVKGGELDINSDDVIVRETLVTTAGAVVHPRCSRAT